jgi:UDP-N-acetylglucosamine--N-acetylmuramyl-(pentapeptide) pyrophosphoryl-undecaprenol N-acetylglucosamine transferase
MKFLFAAGGTAGHVNPALAIADKFKELGADIAFIGTPKGIENTLVTRSGYRFFPVKLAGLQRSLSPADIKRNIKAMWWFLTSQKEIRKILKDFEPNAVIGTGGYVSLPVIKQAAKMKIPVFAHESNSYPGISTKLSAKIVNKLFLGNEEAVKFLPNAEGKIVVTGNPLRQFRAKQDKLSALKELGLPVGFTILSFGGSLGSKTLTSAIAKLIAWENETGGINHIHACGKNGKEIFAESLRESGIVPDPKRTVISDYIYNMYTCYSAADLVISRSGSMTQTELILFGKPSIQIPWAGAAENHQFHNAKSMEKKEAAIVIADGELTAEKLIFAVKTLYASPAKLKRMRDNTEKMAIPDAEERIAGEILKFVDN